MPYYSAGDYYGAGDHIYGRGDFLGIGKALKKLNPLALVGGLVKKVVGSVPIVGGLASSLIPTMGGNRQGMGIIPAHGVPEPGVTGAVHRLFPGGETGYLPRRRMNVTNVRALRRAGRRVRGFLKIANRLGALPVSRSAKGKLFKRKKR